eukprot:1057808-Prymnesium_polylepis.2
MLIGRLIVHSGLVLMEIPDQVREPRGDTRPCRKRDGKPNHVLLPWRGAQAIAANELVYVFVPNEDSGEEDSNAMARLEVGHYFTIVCRKMKTNERVPVFNGHPHDGRYARRSASGMHCIQRTCQAWHERLRPRTCGKGCSMRP